MAIGKRGRRRALWIAAAAGASALAIAMLGGGGAGAAPRTTYGQDFWVAFDHNLETNDTSKLTLYMSSPVPATGTVKIDSLGFNSTFSIGADGLASVNVPLESQLDPNQSFIQALGINVQSSSDVALYGLNRTQYTTDAFTGIPVNSLGTDYRIMSYGPGHGGSEFSVVATQADTKVTFVPTVGNSSYEAGKPATVTLQKGEALEYQVTPPGDLTGSLVKASAPVAVFGAHQCVNIPEGVSACDHIVEAMPPLDSWGKKYVTAPLATRANDTLRVLADKNGTDLTITSGGAPTQVKLEAGESHTFRTGVPSAITSDEPVLVAQFSEGSGSDGTVSDPFMSLVPPYEQYLTEYTVATPGEGFAQNYINLTALADKVGQVSVDGKAVPEADWKPIGNGSAYASTVVPVQPGAHKISGGTPVGVLVYGFDSYDSYGYPGGFGIGAIAQITGLALDPATQTAITGAEACVTGKLTGEPGAKLDGIRVDFAATGKGATTKSVSTGADGSAKFCFASSEDGDSTVTATVSELTATATVLWMQKAPEGSEATCGGRPATIIGYGEPVITGTKKDDVIVGSSAAETINGLGGNDVICGNGGDDKLIGDKGNDTLFGGEGNDTFDGGKGNDALIGDAGNDTFAGGEGRDVIVGGTGNDTVRGDAGNDTVNGEAGNDTIYGGDGRDNITGGSGDDTIHGEAGNDVLRGADGMDKLDGGAGRDQLSGDAGNDLLWGRDGRDDLHGGAGNDQILGGLDDDVLYGDDGDDVLRGEEDDDWLHGGLGEDVLDGGPGHNTLIQE
ncbi:hypothetical protein [Kineosporia babensis]|uniref:IgGFc-binding protein N-terminal domain-containing protein n=1 Tax=Kineosporia babensis TaxID=499548 RepID=A0A9X1NDM5_9ACTN|nr:hypothetical protein [Kineosporia babensis]MCD5313232.1 hypothetical protein [Kineosporia babensis]